jgi:hypothetical protein
MTKVILDSATSSKLAGLDHAIELCDPSGQTLGWFKPVPDPREGEFFVPPFTEKEIQQALDEPGGRSLAEIMADLEKMQ